MRDVLRMHIQIVQFNLNGMMAAEYVEACESVFAEAFRNVEGLVKKVWLSSPETNTFGGVYTWKDRAAMEAFQRTALFVGVVSNPSFINLNSKDFAVLEGPTAITRGLV